MSLKARMCGLFFFGPAIWTQVSTYNASQQDSCPMKFSTPIVLALLVLTPFSVVRAERADSTKPMQIEADRMQHDEPRQTTVLTGKVQAVKGTLVMRADRMEIFQDAQGQQTARFWAAPGERIFFRQKREGLDEFIEGEALQAVYDSRQDLMTLTERAEVRIMRQGQAADRLEGQRIVYDNTREVLQVDGQPQPSATASHPASRPRVRAVLAPRNEASAPASSNAPALRPSPALQPSGSRP